MRLVVPFVIAGLMALTSVWAQEASPEMPEDPRAKAALKRAMRLFEEKKLDDSVAELEAGYAMEPKPIFMFSLATVERYRGNCERATTLYRCYLASNPPKTAKALEGLKECNATYEQPPADQCANVLKTVARDPVRPDGPGGNGTGGGTNSGSGGNEGTEGGSGPRAPEGQSWYQDPLGDVLFGAGIAGVATGVTFLILGNQAAEDANAAPDLERYRTLDDRASQRRLIGYVASGVGGALMVGGIVRWLMVGGDDDDTTGVSAAPTSGGASVTLTGRF